MKRFIIIFIFFAASVSASATNPFEINSRRAGIIIEDDGKTLVIKFSEKQPRNIHTEIDLHKIGDLAYKTQVMRYFGGMLKNDTFHFEKLIIWNEGVKINMDFNRQTVALVVNLMCHPDEVPDAVTLAENTSTNQP
jgi:hypothetical protein